MQIIGAPAVLGGPRLTAIVGAQDGSSRAHHHSGLRVQEGDTEKSVGRPTLLGNP